ncbi:hypothetical protein AAF712_005561 [Marasmius tenuissimus]|uniref:Ion transport domain-containing protein n=1 Tax=Marasmius tenuissimus TaxID=585030 RepID=A0ABR3A1Y8_9AGAR
MSTGAGIELSRLNHSATHFLTEDPNTSPTGIRQLVFGENSQNHEQEQLASIHPLWKRELFALLEQPKSSSGAMLIHVLMTSLILTSAVVTVSAVLVWDRDYFGGHVYCGISREMCRMEFIMEKLAKMGDLPHPTFLSLLPALTNDSTIEVMYISVRRSQYALFAIGFFVIMVLTVFSTLLYFAERGTWDTTLETFINSDGDPTQFASIPAAAWFVLVTITTVGYGEITPRSFLGRLVTLPLLVFGLLLIALPSFVLGREFSLVWEKMSSKRSEDEDVYHDMDSPVQHRRPLPNVNAGNGDLSNMKLAQNQTELSNQISELRDTVELQGVLIKRLLAALEKGKQREE